MADKIPKELLLMIMKKKTNNGVDNANDTPGVEEIGDYPNDGTPITDSTKEEHDITTEKKRRFGSLQKMMGSSGKKFASSKDEDDEYIPLR